MGQTRLYDYGRPLQASTQIVANASLCAAGVLFGLELSPLAGQISMAAGAAITPEGVLVVEDEARTLAFTLTAAVKQYTLFMDHTFGLQSGGSPATYVLEEGLTEQSATATRTVIGWVVYPGGSVALDSSMLYAPASLRVGGAPTPPPLLLAGFPVMDGPLAEGKLISVLAADVSASQSIAFASEVTRWTNAHAVNPEDADLYFYAEPSGISPKLVELSYATSDIGVILEVYLRRRSPTTGVWSETLVDTQTGVVVVLAAVDIYNYSLAMLPANRPTATEQWGLRLRVTLPALQTFDLRALRVSNSAVPSV